MLSENRTDTHVEWMNEPHGLALSFSGRINLFDLSELMKTLDHVDRAVVNSPINSAADLFQTLEIIFRRRAERALAEARGWAVTGSPVNHDSLVVVTRK
jgi:hypothetical protein